MSKMGVIWVSYWQTLPPVSWKHLQQACLNTFLKLSATTVGLLTFFLGYRLKLLIGWWTACLSLNAVYKNCLLSVFGLLLSFLLFACWSSTNNLVTKPVWNGNSCNSFPGLQILFRIVFYCPPRVSCNQLQLPLSPLKQWFSTGQASGPTFSFVNKSQHETLNHSNLFNKKSCCNIYIRFSAYNMN